MAVTLRRPGARPRQRALRNGPSVREVCLLGPTRAPAALAPGAGIELEGRAYRVASTSPARPDADCPRYIHLTPGAADRP